MADQDDVGRIALSLPQTVEGQDRFAFSVLNKGTEKAFAWVWLERTEPKTMSSGSSSRKKAKRNGVPRRRPAAGPARS